jgi:hypothetical protein
MKTSKLLVASALLLGGTSASFAQVIGPSVNSPIIYGGGSIGSNRNLNSALQNTLPYHWTREQRRAQLEWLYDNSTDPNIRGIPGRCAHCAEGED